MKIAIINGPNLNLLGKREPEIYGNTSFEDFLQSLRNEFPDTELEYFQSNIEGELINFVHEAGSRCNAIIINAGGYTHTSVALADALKTITIPYVEVHISNIFSREPYRHTSFIGEKAAGVIAGFGMNSYRLAIQSLLYTK